MHGVSDQQAEGDAWSKTLATAWNRLMRALHGNGLPAGQVVMQAINCNGVRVRGRWAQVCSLEADILALTETHATDAAQKTLVHEAAGWNVHWGKPTEPSDRTGVAILVRSKAAWVTTSLDFKGTSVEKYVDAGRVCAVRVHGGSGKRSFLVYAVYGHAGARWSEGKKRVLEQMLKAVTEDAAARGGVAAYVLGDINVEVSESKYLQKILAHGGWHDAAAWGAHGLDGTHTSHKGAGSRIDLGLVNATGAALVRKYAVRPGIVPREHSAVEVVVAMPAAAQMRHAVRTVGAGVEYEEAPEDYEPNKGETQPEGIRDALRAGDVDKAFGLWCKWSEELLREVPLRGGGHVEGTGRGKVTWRRECVYPQEREAHAATLKTRRVAAAYRRAE
jgi:hypothetical protein